MQAAILARAAASCRSSASTNGQASAVASARPMVVLPHPDGPITTMITLISYHRPPPTITDHHLAQISRRTELAFSAPGIILLFVQAYNEAAMIKKLSAVGNSLGLIIERPILELLDITKDTQLEVKTDGEALIIRPVKLSKKQRIRESTKRMMAVHDETLRKLAK